MIMTEVERGVITPADRIARLRKPRSEHIPPICEREQARRVWVLRQAIKLAGSRPALAEATGISTQSMRRWELCQQAMPDKRLGQLRRYLENNR